MKQTYDHEFFKDHHAMTVYAARTILPIVLDALPSVRSTVDFGCGVGTWLSVLAEQGVEDLLGMDGAWVEKELLEIAEERFRKVDLERPIELDRRFDLAMALEVAEHLPPASAQGFVDSLTRASDFVLFSAAVPFQGGEGHVNEQWPDYWAGLFARCGFVPVDLVRRHIWKDRRVPVWYRQNLLLFVKESEKEHLDLDVSAHEGLPLSLVHPDLYLLRMEGAMTLRGGWRALRRGLQASLKKTIRGG